LITVLRFGHRRTRDQRVTTHVALVSRAFGADEIIICGDSDESLEKSVKAVVKNWGGEFSIRQTKEWLKEIKKKKAAGAKIVHLTMYGEKIMGRMEEMRACKDIVVIVGSQKVPIEAYREADYNISVTGQPHSEIAALAIFLDRYLGGRELDSEMTGGKRILPSKFGKNVVSCARREQV
jgi:tRNA (cytidine56-2'-O)-methyltransferase